MLLLKILSKADYYGYEIILILRKITNNIINITAGSIYPELYKLHEKEYIVAILKINYLKWKKEGRFLRELRKQIEEYAMRHPNTEYKEIEEAFATPEDVIYDFFSLTGTLKIVNQ